MHAEVLRLRRESFKYDAIAAEIKRKFKTRVPKATISNWCTGLSTPAQSGHLFVPQSTPELAYVIGVETGDAFLNVKPKSYEYRIRLRAADREFVEEFNDAVAKVLGCRPHRLWKGETEEVVHVEFGSYLLHKFLLQPLEALRPFIEHDERCVAAFLKGFFDSEGCIDRRGAITAYNCDLQLLRFVQGLLSRWFGIETTGPCRGTRKGSTVTNRGKSYRRRADCFSIYVRRRFNVQFDSIIGFTIRRKQIRLDRYISSKLSRVMRSHPLC